MEWSPISERIILARSKTKIRNLTIIQSYAPTEMMDKDIKEKFYQQLHETVIAVQKMDVIIVMGDMNAKLDQTMKVWNMSCVDMELET